MYPELSPDLIRRRLTSLFPAELIEDIALARDVFQRHHTIDITVLIWILILGFAVDGEACTIAGFQRAYSAATNQTVAQSSFYDRFTPALAALLSDLLEHVLEEVAVPHTIAPQFELFREVLSLLLQNVWRYLHYEFVATPRRGGRRHWWWPYKEFVNMVRRAAGTALAVRRAVPANRPPDDRFQR